MEVIPLEDVDDDGPRNSFAPNDGYVRGSTKFVGKNVNMSKNAYLQCFGMMRKMKNPQPNFLDNMMYHLWRRVGVYLPLAGILALMDFILDWMTSLELISNDLCYLKIFGVMMMMTLTFLPIAYSVIKASDDERKYWERLFRVILGRPKLNPYAKWAPPKDDKVLYYLAKIFYHTFSCWTHVVSQVSVHVSHASEVDQYMEYNIRSRKVMKHLEEGKFVEFDKDEFKKLKALQYRASQYILYYAKYAKGRLKFCLIEDAIQYNIQMAVLVFSAFSPHVNKVEFDYTDNQHLGFLATYFYATASTIRLFRLLLRVVSLFTSVLSMWVALYQAERFHEMLRTKQPVSMGRVCALAVKTVIEILMPTFTLVLFTMDRPSIIPDTDECPSNYLLHSAGLYLMFPLGYTFVSHFGWAYILNMSNRDDQTRRVIFWETLEMTIYSACLTIKYSRISGRDDTMDTEFHAGPWQYLILCLANIIKFVLPTLMIIMGLPSTDLTPNNFSREHHLAVSDSMSFKYEFDHPVPDIADPVIKVLDYTDDWQFLPKKVTPIQLLVNPSLSGVGFDSYFNGNSSTGFQIMQEAVSFTKSSTVEYLCKTMDIGKPVNIDDVIKMTICVWGPRITINDQTIPHFMIFASFGELPDDINSLAWLNAADKLPNGKRVFEMRNERLIMLRHAVDVFCNMKENFEDEKFGCKNAQYYISFVESNLGSINKTDDEDHTNRMISLYEVLKTLPPVSDNNDHVRSKIILYCFITYVVFTISYILAEIDYPYVSKTLRYNFAAKFYPYLLPAFLLMFALQLTYSGILKSTKAYCQMNPESDQQVFFGTIQLDCIEKTTIRTSAEDTSEKEKFLSMAKCGIGMFCKYCRKGFDCNDISNWRRIASETTEPCMKQAKSDYEYNLLPHYVHGQTWGALNKLTLDEDDQLTCYFDPELISKVPVGPDIDPMNCPQVVRRIFKGVNIDLPDKFIYKFGFLKTETQRILEIRNNRKLIYGDTDFPWQNIPQRFPQPTRSLEELTYEDWLSYARTKLSEEDSEKFRGEIMTQEFSTKSCLQVGNSLISGISLYGNVEIGGMLLTEPKKQYFLSDLLLNELTGVLSPDVMMLNNTYAKT